VNGATHYRAAEQLLEVGTNMTGKTDEIQAVLTTAQVHATLALAAATALDHMPGYSTISDDLGQQWLGVIA
jgi:mannose/fructose-specific phosphotransferase system component IIA